MRRGFIHHIAADSLDQCLKEHEEMWPEMQQALVKSGWHNYSMFCRPDGLVFGYAETEAAGLDQAIASLGNNEVWEGQCDGTCPDKGLMNLMLQQLLPLLALMILKPSHFM